MSATFSYGSASFTPAEVDGWDQARPSGTREHPYIGGGSDYTVRPSQPRRIQWVLVFRDEATALQAEALLVSAPYVDATSDDLAIVSGRYVRAEGGQVQVQLDPATRTVFLVNADMAEVTQ